MRVTYFDLIFCGGFLALGGSYVGGIAIIIYAVVRPVVGVWLPESAVKRTSTDA